MEKFLTGGAGYLAILAAVVVLVTVGVMSILLPILVFRILAEVSRINDKMSKIVPLLSEAAKASREPQGQRQSDESRMGPLVSKRSGATDIGEKSLRFK